MKSVCLEYRVPTNMKDKRKQPKNRGCVASNQQHPHVFNRFQGNLSCIKCPFPTHSQRSEEEAWGQREDPSDAALHTRNEEGTDRHLAALVVTQG